MRRYLISAAAMVMLLTGCGSPGNNPESPSATQTQSASSPSIQPPTLEPTPPFSPAIPPPPPEVVCEVTDASAETGYGELVSGDNADLSAALTAWSMGDVMNEFDIVLASHDQDTPSIHLVLHVLVESGYVVQGAQLVWPSGEQEELFVDYYGAPTDREEGQAEEVVVLFGDDPDRWIQLTVVC